MAGELDFSAWENAPVVVEKKEEMETHVQKLLLRRAGCALSSVMNSISYADYFWQYDWEYQELDELGDATSNVITRNIVWLEMNVRYHGVYLARILKVKKFFGYLKPLDSLIGRPLGDLDSRGDTAVFLPVGCVQSQEWLDRSLYQSQVILTGKEVVTEKIEIEELCAELKWVPKGTYREVGECV